MKVIDNIDELIEVLQLDSILMVAWRNLAKKFPLSEKFMNTYYGRLIWDDISLFQKNLSEEFISKHSNKLCWVSVSCRQKLSESFIEKYKHKVWWLGIKQHQELSEKFIIKHRDKLFLKEWTYQTENK